MTKRDEIDELCASIAEMARRVNAVFVPDPHKIARFRAYRATRLYYRYNCPRPIGEDRSARACVAAGKCGCDNAARYGH